MPSCWRSRRRRLFLFGGGKLWNNQGKSNCPFFGGIKEGKFRGILRDKQSFGGIGLKMFEGCFAMDLFWGNISVKMVKTLF